MIDTILDFLGYSYDNTVTNHNDALTSLNEDNQPICLSSEDLFFTYPTSSNIQAKISNLPNEEQSFLFFELGISDYTQTIFDRTQWDDPKQFFRISNIIYTKPPKGVLVSGGYGMIEEKGSDYIRLMDNKILEPNCTLFSNEYKDIAIKAIKEQFEQGLTQSSIKFADDLSTSMVNIISVVHSQFVQLCGGNNEDVEYTFLLQFNANSTTERGGWHVDSVPSYRLLFLLNEIPTLFSYDLNDSGPRSPDSEIFQAPVGSASFFKGYLTVHAAPKYTIIENYYRMMLWADLRCGVA